MEQSVAPATITGSALVQPVKQKYFVAGAPITAKEAATCRCVLHVAARQPDWCLQNGVYNLPVGDPRKQRVNAETGQTETCYNPFAVCVASTHGSYPAGKCGQYIDRNEIPANELRARQLMLGKSTDTV
jgi:hypothetical protein